MFEPNSIEFHQARQNSFSTWPPRTIPSKEMIKAGFSYTNVADRVICIHCNLICEKWIQHTDDPCKVHRTLSPNCIFVQTKLVNSGRLLIINSSSRSAETNSNDYLLNLNVSDLLQRTMTVPATAYYPAYAELPKRHASFAPWPNDNLPLVDDFVHAGFFYTGTRTVVTCFYCNGSIQNWGPTDNPKIEHVRRFPHCAYVKQLCEPKLYEEIQGSNVAQHEIPRPTNMRDRTASGTTTSTRSRLLFIPDEHALNRLVTARLDLPMSKRLLDQNFEPSIIKRCWEEQLRLKQHDFDYEYELNFACLMLQKQIEHINRKEENIITPSIKMAQIQEENEERLHEKPTNMTDVDTPTSSLDSTTDSQNQKPSVNATPSNPCALCLTEERKIACIPCGHLATCVPCGHSLKKCPICREGIKMFMSIYI